MFHDPAETLIKLRRLELDLLSLDLDGEARELLRLRTNDLKRYREWRDAALFTYLMAKASGHDIGYATEEAQDYDFVTAWLEADQQMFCPVQLKELPPADLNQQMSLEALLTSLARWTQPTTTVLAILLNRAERIDFDVIRLPGLGFQQVWFFAAIAPDSSRWTLIGDMKGTPRRYEFPYPEG